MVLLRIRHWGRNVRDEKGEGKGQGGSRSEWRRTRKRMRIASKMQTDRGWRTINHLSPTICCESPTATSRCFCARTPLDSICMRPGLHAASHGFTTHRTQLGKPCPSLIQRNRRRSVNGQPTPTSRGRTRMSLSRTDPRNDRQGACFPNLPLHQLQTCEAPPGRRANSVVLQQRRPCMQLGTSTTRARHHSSSTGSLNSRSDPEPTVQPKRAKKNALTGTRTPVESNR